MADRAAAWADPSFEIGVVNDTPCRCRATESSFDASAEASPNAAPGSERREGSTVNADPIAEPIEGAARAEHDERRGLVVELDGAPYFLQIEPFELGIPERDLDVVIEVAERFIRAGG